MRPMLARCAFGGEQALRDECKVLWEEVGAYKYLVLVSPTTWEHLRVQRMCKRAPVWEPESSELPSRRSKGQQGRDLLKGKTKRNKLLVTDYFSIRWDSVC